MGLAFTVAWFPERWASSRSRLPVPNPTARFRDAGQSPAIIDQADLQSLALRYRPALMLDSSEHYRPITVDSLLAERDANNNPVHERCVMQLAGEPADCSLVGSVDELIQNSPGDPPYLAWLSIWPYNSATSSDYHSPPTFLCPTTIMRATGKAKQSSSIRRPAPIPALCE